MRLLCAVLFVATILMGLSACFSDRRVGDFATDRGVGSGLDAFRPIADPVLLQSSEGLPRLTDLTRRPTTDWLVDNSGFKAAVYGGDTSKDLVLSNGLISRVFRLAPNGATVRLEDHVNGQTLLRGVKPEAIVTINGARLEVGGLKGQPNYAFLRPQWIDELDADPAAMRFVGYSVGRPRERLPWKQTRRHGPGVNWPPKGVALTMVYEMPAAEQVPLTSPPAPSARGRQLLLSDDFSVVTDAWQYHSTNAHPRSSFRNEGKPGEIYTLTNTYVYAERALPRQTRLVELLIDPGTDRGKTWGPGLALVWRNGTVIRFNVRPASVAEKRDGEFFGVSDARGERLRGGGEPAGDWLRPLALRFRMEGGMLYMEARPEDGDWRTIDQREFSSDEAPVAVRVGKMGPKGDAQDFSGDKGSLGRTHIQRLSVYSALDAEGLRVERERLEALRGVRVSVHYELYDGAPVICKWIEIHNDGDQTVQVDHFVSEILAAVESESRVEAPGIHYPPPRIHVETDYAFHGMTSVNASRRSVHWVPDPDYTTQVNYQRLTPCLLEARPEEGPAQTLEPGRIFESFHTFLFPQGDGDRERLGLAQRRVYRLLAPWVTENPLMMHVRFADWDSVKKAIDQCADVGFEMVILTFGSGFNIENNATEYLAKMKEYADYAQSRGIEIGGYSLLASRRISDKDDVVMPPGESPTFGASPCLESEWGQDYFNKLYHFYETTGFDLLEHDGSYPGDICLSESHPGHRGRADSRWNQWRRITEFYKWCRGKGIFLNVPDYYYLSGSSKSGMGYREVNWSLPRDQQVIHTRQNIYDGTWQKTPSMGWMFVPLTQYHGGGAAATIEPLDEHRDHYERMLVSNLGAGVQACYRGPRLYDTPATRDLVKKWVDWFKAHRDVLEGDLIHLRRADGQDIDYWLNVNPGGEEKGLLMVFNPLEHDVAKTIRVPLYYTGLTEGVTLINAAGEATTTTLNRAYEMDLPVRVPARGFTWYIFR